MFRQNKYILLLGFVFLFSCNSPKNVVKVQNINNIKELSTNNVFYNLPKTQIIVAFEVNMITKVPGIFAPYAQKYLGIDDPITSTETHWSICSIKFYTNPIVDTSYSFVINIPKSDLLLPLKTSKEGFPIAFNSADYNFQISELPFISATQSNQEVQNSVASYFSPIKSYKIVYDTTYKEQILDTTILKLPILQPSIARKSIEEQAKDIADKLNNLREDRYLLIASQSDKSIADATVLSKMLCELDKLEQQYINDFVGFNDTTKYTYYFSYIPNSDDFEINVPLFKFNTASGISPSDNSGNIVFLNIYADKSFSEKYQKYNSGVELVNQNRKGANSLFYFRKPQLTNLKITINSQTIAETNIFVAQLGSIINISANSLLTPDLKILFNPELGSIESIEYK